MTPATWCLLVAVLTGIVGRQVDGLRTDHHRMLDDLVGHLDRHLDPNLDPNLDREDTQ